MKRRIVTAVATLTLACPWLAAAAPRSAQIAAAAPTEFPVKPTGPIAVEYRRMGEPTVGAPLTIAITARVEEGAAGLSIDVSATVPRAVLVALPTLVEAGEGVYSWEITVVPLVADAGYLTVIVSGAIDGVEQARSVTVPLGSAPTGSAADAVVAAGDEPLVALPVQESP